jgi:predicted site-specific integrase-resolvase
MTSATTRVLWTRQETAKRLGVCPHSVMNLEKRGLLSAVRFGRRFVRYRPEEVERLLQEMSTGGKR